MNMCDLLCLYIYYAAENSESSNYGATQAILVQGQSKAKKRVIYFIAVFIVNGLFSEGTLQHYILFRMFFRP